MRALRELLAVALLLPAAAASGQPAFEADVGTLIDGDGASLTHLVLSFPRVSSDLLVGVRFRGDGDLDLERSWVVKPDELEEGAGGRRIWARAFELPPGEATARIRVQDLEEAADSETKLSFRVPSRGDAPLGLSDLFFGSCRESPAEGAPPWSVLDPNPGRVFGRLVQELCVFARVVDAAPPEAGAAYDVRVRVRNDRGKTVDEERLEIPRRDGSGRILYRPGIEELTRGRYEVRVEVSLDGGEAAAEGWFKIDDSRLSIYGDPDKIRGVLEIIATNEELLALEETPDSSLPAFWDAFWERRDPVTETEINEAMLEFLERVDVATRRFGTLDPGWRTDRGRVYIQLGPPDLEELAGEPRDSLIWYYHDRNLSFVFQDVDGFGRYRLIGRRRP